MLHYLIYYGTYFVIPFCATIAIIYFFGIAYDDLKPRIMIAAGWLIALLLIVAMFHGGFDLFNFSRMILYVAGFVLALIVILLRDLFK